MASISIHAPTRGATQQIYGARPEKTFQSTLPREERPTIGTLGQFPVLFQSTLPREERQVSSVSTHRRSYFNPRSHERSDRYVMPIFPSSSTFQSTLPREERLNKFMVLVLKRHFNPRSHERSDDTI